MRVYCVVDGMNVVLHRIVNVCSQGVKYMVLGQPYVKVFSNKETSPTLGAHNFLIPAQNWMTTSAVASGTPTLFENHDH
jgi:hypothetical protein